MYGKNELYSYADTTVAVDNFCILLYTGKYCDVSPDCDDYKSIKVVPIVHSYSYILVLHETLWMGDTLYHTWVNQNQLFHYGTRVQDNLISEITLSIITEDGEVSM